MNNATGYDSANFHDGAVPLGPPSDDADAQLVNDTRRQIRELVAEVARLAQSDISPPEFYDGFLSRIVGALAAVGGAIWTVREGSDLELAYRINLEAAAPDLDGDAGGRHYKLLQRTVVASQPLAAPPKSGCPDDAEAGNPTSLLLLLCPLTVDRETVGLIEVLQRPGAGPTTQRGYLRFLLQMSELAEGYFKSRKLRRYAERETMWGKLETFLGEIHRSADLPRTAFAVVNESRRVLECDRVSIALLRGRRCEIAAVSGLDHVNRRAEQVAALAALASAVVAAREPFWTSSSPEKLPPQIERPLQRYLDCAHSKSLGIIPLDNSMEDDKETELLGALIVEQLSDDRFGETFHERLQTVTRYITPALQNAVQRHGIFLLPLWQKLGAWQQRWLSTGKAKLFGGIGAIVFLLVALCVIPAPFDLSVRGRLLPSESWEIFAPVDGTVLNVPVRHGQQVAAGDVLVELTNTEIDVELTELLGRRRIAQEQLESNQRTLLDGARGGRPKLSMIDENRLSGEILQLRQTMDGLDREIGLVRRKQARLTVRAEHPGQVVTWQLERTLLRRPVQAGQALLTIENPAGSWELELRLPERRLTHVDAALAGTKQPLEVTFMLSTQPGVSHRARVIEIQRTAEVRGEEGNTLLVRAAFDKAKLGELRGDTTVAAKLHCGTRSIGYVWFCDVLETVRTWWLFWV